MSAVGVAVEEVEVVDEPERLDGEHCRDVPVVDLEQVVAVVFLAAVGEVRRSAIDDGVVTVEPADDELVVHLVTQARRREPG